MRTALTIALLAPPLAAQARWTHEFTRVAAACERSDGSIVVTDAGDAGIVVLAPGGTARVVGRRGVGPGEYQSPGQCFALAHDTTLVLDRAVRRFVVVAPDNQLTTLSYPPALSGAWYEPLGADERGNLLFRGRQTGTQAPILRWDRRSQRVDTLTLFRVGAEKSLAVGNMAVSRTLPFAPEAAVVATPALGVAIVRPDPFAVEILKDGASKRSDATPFAPVPVDDGDIAQYIEKLAPPRNTQAVRSDGQRVSIPEQQWKLENFGLTRGDFPAKKPAFDPERVYATPGGAVWVRVHRPSAERAERYEVWTPAGRRGAPVTLGAARRLAGVGARCAYVVMTNDDGIQFVECSPIAPS